MLRNPSEIIETKENKKPEQRYRYVSLRDAELNPEYMQIVQNKYSNLTERAARFVQAKYRAKYKNIPDNSVSMSLIKEPYGLKYRKHAELIKEGYWCEVKYSEPEFNRNIYKALHLGKINGDHAVTALMLSSALKEYINEHHTMSFTKHRFAFGDDAKHGPYDPRTIVYSDPKKIKTFEEKLKALPDSQQYYFSFDLPKLKTVMYLYYGLKKDRNNYVTGDKFNNHLKKYLERLSIEPTKKAELMEYVSQLFDKNKSGNAKYKLRMFIANSQAPLTDNFYIYTSLSDISEAIDSYSKLTNPDTVDIINLIKTTEEMVRLKYLAAGKCELPDLEKIKNNILDLGTVKQFENFINEQISFFSFLDKDAEGASFITTLLSLNEQIPNIEISHHYDKDDPSTPLLCMILPTLGAFRELQSAFFGKNAIQPFYTVGKFTPTFIKTIDEQKGMRPIELIHPDVPFNAAPHGYSTHQFTLEWHDLWHCWRSSRISQKDTIRYLRKLLEIEKGFPMSNHIWLLTDMDFSTGEMTVWTIDDVIKLSRIKLADFDKNDNGLLVLIDMVLNASHWESLVYGHPITLLTSHGFNVATPANDIQEIHKKVLKSEKSREKLFYILAYRLRNQENYFELCQAFFGAGHHKKLFWHKNKGLQFTAEDKEHSTVFIENLTADELSARMKQCLTPSSQQKSEVREYKKNHPMSKISNSFSSLFASKKIIALGAIGVAAGAIVYHRSLGQ